MKDIKQVFQQMKTVETPLNSLLVKCYPALGETNDDLVKAVKIFAIKHELPAGKEPTEEEYLPAGNILIDNFELNSMIICVPTHVNQHKMKEDFEKENPGRFECIPGDGTMKTTQPDYEARLAAYERILSETEWQNSARPHLSEAGVEDDATVVIAQNAEGNTGHDATSDIIDYVVHHTKYDDINPVSKDAFLQPKSHALATDYLHHAVYLALQKEVDPNRVIEGMEKRFPGKYEYIATHGAIAKTLPFHEIKERDGVLQYVRDIAQDLGNVEGFEVDDEATEYLFTLLESLGHDMDSGPLVPMLRERLKETEAQSEKGLFKPEASVEELVSLYRGFKWFLETLLEKAEDVICEDNYHFAELLGSAVLEHVPQSEENIKTGIFDKAEKLASMSDKKHKPEDPSAGLPIQSNE